MKLAIKGNNFLKIYTFSIFETSCSNLQRNSSPEEDFPDPKWLSDDKILLRSNTFKKIKIKTNKKTQLIRQMTIAKVQCLKSKVLLYR